MIETLYHARKSKKLWNVIRRTKVSADANGAISMQNLVEHFKVKFSSDNNKSSAVKQAQQEVNAKYSQLISQYPGKGQIISVTKIRYYVNLLNSNTAAGCDGVTAEHIKFAMQSQQLPVHLSNMLSLCIRHSVIPSHFNKGILLPILKKSTLDPSAPGSYRPITVSVVFSKLLELYILDRCDIEMNPAQFGFVQGRNTNMATALAHDIGVYSLSKGSPTYYCSLDAEGAYDALPHSVILKKCIDVVPDDIWLVLYQWYANMWVYI